MGEGAPFLGPWRGRRGLAESGGDESVQERVWSRLEDGPTSSREWGTWRASRPDRVPLCVFPWPRAASWTPKLRKLGAVRGQLDVWRVVRLCDVGGPLVCFWPYTRRLQGAPFGQSPPTRRGRTDFSKRPFSRASVRPAERPAGNAEGRPTEPSMRPECDPNARRRAWCDNGGPVLARASRRGGLWRRFERHDPPRADAAARRPSAPGRLLCARAAAPGRRRRHLVQRRPRRRRRRRCGAGAPGFHHRRLARRRPRRGAEQPGRPRAPQAQPGPGFGALWRSPGQGPTPLKYPKRPEKTRKKTHKKKKSKGPTKQAPHLFQPCFNGALLAFKVGNLQDSFSMVAKSLALHPAHSDSAELSKTLTRQFFGA
mmetsp:Transcript_22815/g.81434  ORF Transcript_22815/g.81434 Transcript_22815/m.81434 type:complete len:370 (-) Transcript_22815:65-1174(-)